MDICMNILERKTHARTVPRIFIGGEFVGGYDDIQKINSSGSLDKKLKNL